jgi:hypothetical protein
VTPEDKARMVNQMHEQLRHTLHAKRRRATDPQDPHLMEFGLQHDCEDGRVLQVVIWSKDTLTENQKTALGVALKFIEAVPK